VVPGQTNVVLGLLQTVEALAMVPATELSFKLYLQCAEVRSIALLLLW
jgi:hypothetical protein